jgi:hypothetical protein
MDGMREGAELGETEGALESDGWVDTDGELDSEGADETDGTADGSELGSELKLGCADGVLNSGT